ncbi:MAG: aldo/keto reductase family protein [Rhizobiaceae bacterium]
MQYRRLGNSDLEISEISLGSWLTYGTGVDRDQAKACIRQAIDLGINFFDTANMYGKGAAETQLGNILSAYPRADYLLATKVYYPMSDTDRGLSRAQIFKQIDASLKRLRTDYVDLYQCHRYDDETPLEETMEAMVEVVKSGKVRFIGFSEWSVCQIKAAARHDGSVKFVSSQPRYSMLYRKPERKIFPICNELQIGQIVWSPLAQGILTGKYWPERDPPENSRAAARRIGRFSRDKVLRAVQNLRPIAQEHSASLSQLALAWVLTKESVSSAIIGASRPEQIVENAKATGIELCQEGLQEIDRILSDVIRS